MPHNNSIKTIEMQKRRKVFLGVTLIAIVAIAGIGIFWFFIAPAVDFWLDTEYLYQKVGNNWVTVNSINNNTLNGTVIPFHCKSYGLLTSSFKITVVFSGASFSNDTQLPYQEINSATAKFDFTLNSGQEKNVNVYFTITSNNNFTISLSIESNQGLLRIIDAQKFGSPPWQQSYRELDYYSLNNKLFAPALIS
jgi:hypothetical protein